MHTSLRKMGNSTGMIVPRAMLNAIGVTTGAAMDLTIENGRLVATPVVTPVRAGWADAASHLGEDDNADWRAFGTAEDADLTW